MITTRTADGQCFQGTGFLVSPNGLLVTNMHVVRGAVRTQVRLMNGRTYPVLRTVNCDSVKDIAILKIDGRGLPSVTWGNSGAVNVGARVYVVGNPRGLENTISEGLLSGTRDVGAYRLLQISAPISPGSSGSPVFDRAGRVIGVAVSTLEGGQNLNFAVPANYVGRL